jgi:cis-3-alkyl-4-acyloxetan-2-one decarboxylase
MTEAHLKMTGPWRSLYPDCSRELHAGGLRYHYLDSGHSVSSSAAAGDRAVGSDLPVILCVHGNPTWSFYWRRVFERFGDSHRVIAVDHIGCGLSDKPSEREFDYSLPSHRDRLVQLIESLDLRNVILLAHDWGGAIGLAAALRCVERMSGIALLNTAAFPPPYVPWRIAACRTPLLGTLAVRGANLFARAALRMTMNRSRLSEPVAQGLIYPYGNWRDRVAIDAFVKDIPMSPRHRTYAVLQQLETDLKRLEHVPKLLVWGMKDWCFRPEGLQRFLQHWPDATAIRLADAGHYVIEDDPEATLGALADFLCRVQDRR